MNKIIPSFQSKIFTKSINHDEYRLYRAALEWNLVDPIVIESQDDFRSEQDWKDKLEPYHHQITNLITYCRRLPVTLLADDVGLGKTISAGLIASELISRNRISKILIVCPKILMPQWKEELDLKFGINSVEAIGRDLLNIKLPGDSGAVITTYHSAKAYLDHISEQGFQMLILDEAHKLRNLYGTTNSPQVAIRFQKALEDRMFKYVLMLTATPIHNRLWDIYSLVDLLAVARGHENPFGSEGMFARNYILDSRAKARQLVPQMKDQFRKIVYSYMHRTRRAEVKLYFPERKVQLNKVIPTSFENDLLRVIAKPIQEMNPLVQIGLLQAFVSSPQAFYSQLRNMGLKGTVNQSVVNEVGNIVKTMGNSAKLEGLKKLVDELKKEQGDSWRMVIFTERLETQTTIEIFLEEQGISCGLINGSTGSKNQQMLKAFREEIPEINVVISTRAGSEGVNLQASNILVNYDLPWNPMIVEQRIGRIQRLASEHKNVVIFNIVLQGTFEEYIVGRLMEKLQMASHAIGDIDALLEAAGVDEDKGFDEKIRKLVLDSLAGKDVEKATRLTEESIENAKTLLSEEEENMNILLGSSSDVANIGPRCPKLPSVSRSMDIKDFTISALNNFNAKCDKKEGDRFYIKYNDKHETISFNNDDKQIDGVTLCRPGIPFFERLVTDVVNNPLHLVDDIDNQLSENLKRLLEKWSSDFSAIYSNFEIEKSKRHFKGKAILRVNVTVAHDSYERLVEVDCVSEGEYSNNENLSNTIERSLSNPESLGLSLDLLKNSAMNDEGVSEFCRFYQERLLEEKKSIKDDLSKIKKIEDDFTPSVDIVLVGLEGEMFRTLEVKVSYKIQSDYEYKSLLIITPSSNNIIAGPDIKQCDHSRIKAPVDCFGKCSISKINVLKHLLKSSEITGRKAMSEYLLRCSLSKKNILKDEAEKSDITNNIVASEYLKTSSLCGKKGEPEYFDKCDFTNSEVLKTEIAISQVSGKKYRVDQEMTSSVSGKRGHEQEFIKCPERDVVLLSGEAEKCEISGKMVSPGVLETCEMTNKMVMPSELLKCSYTGKKALKKYFVTSSISGAQILEEQAVRANSGNFCTPSESKKCSWSNEVCHIDDLLIDSLSGLPMHFRFLEINNNNKFQILSDLLNGRTRKNSRQELWELLQDEARRLLGLGQYLVESIEESLDKKNLAVCIKVKTWVGFKTRYVGFVYSLTSKAIKGDFVIGKRDKQTWVKK